MKKLIAIVLVMAEMLSLVGCADIEKSAKKMYIEPAQLTEEEALLAYLVCLICSLYILR